MSTEPVVSSQTNEALMRFVREYVEDSPQTVLNEAAVLCALIVDTVKESHAEDFSTLHEGVSLDAAGSQILGYVDEAFDGEILDEIESACQRCFREDYEKASRKFWGEVQATSIKYLEYLWKKHQI